MIFVLASVVCSVLVSVLLKLAPRWRVDITQAIAWNYVLALAATALLLRPPPATAQAPWWTLAALGLLLPTIFLVLASSVREAGIVRSDAAQRLSLILPLAAAFLLFGERLTPLKAAGAGLGLVALAAMVWRGRPRESRAGAGAWLWPLGVFAGFGLIDVLFKRVAAAGLPLGSSLLAVFALALVVAFAIVGWRRRRLELPSFAAGLAIGLANFGNILFYLRAHRALPDSPALVFAGMNLGVVMLGALLGVAAFGERLSRVNWFGLALALLAVLLLAAA